RFAEELPPGLQPGHDGRLALQREGTGGAGCHALSARHARGLPHREIEVERDAGRVTLPTAPDHEVRLHLAARPDAAVAENPRVVIDGDVGVRELPSYRRRPAPEPLRDLQVPRQALELAVSGLGLPGAWHRVIGEQQLRERPTHPLDSLGPGGYLHAG